MAASEKSLRHLIFNKTTGVIVGEVKTPNFDPQSIGEGFVVKSVEMDEDDYWFGDYETGEVFSRQEKPIINQQEVREAATRNIYSEYDLYDQINLILEQVMALTSEETLVPKFGEMVARIEELRQAYKMQTEEYASNPEIYNWVDEERMNEIITERYNHLNITD
jgi:hypothetical protein